MFQLPVFGSVIARSAVIRTYSRLIAPIRGSSHFDLLRATATKYDLQPIRILHSAFPRCRFNTSVTEMVQNIGNIWQAGLSNLRDAMENSRTYEAEERVCIESDSYPQF